MFLLPNHFISVFLRSAPPRGPRLRASSMVCSKRARRKQRGWPLWSKNKPYHLPLLSALSSPPPPPRDLRWLRCCWRTSTPLIPPHPPSPLWLRCSTRLLALGTSSRHPTCGPCGHSGAIGVGRPSDFSTTDHGRLVSLRARPPACPQGHAA